MNTMQIVLRNLTASAAILILGGCSAVVPGMLPGQSIGSVRQNESGTTSDMAAGRSLEGVTSDRVFVSDYLNNAIEIYPQGTSHPTPIGSITDGIHGPLGTFVDKSGTLYVTNLVANTVTEYQIGSGKRIKTIQSGINGPMSVTADANGDLAVSQYAAHQSSIVEFKGGSPYARQIITSLTYPAGVAIDRHGYLWVAWNTQGDNGYVGHVSTCQLFSRTCVNTGIAIGQTGGLAIDAAGDLLVGDQTHFSIDVFAPGAHRPFRRITLFDHVPYSFVLDEPQRRLYIADYPTGTVVVYNYATGAQLGKIVNGLTSAWGVSVDPPATHGP